MVKQKLNAILNFLLIISLAICVGSIYFSHDKAIHTISGIILTILIVIHLAFHWDYLKNLGRIFKS